MTPSRDRPFVKYTPSGKLVTHGGAGTAYASYGCRCDECTAANTVRIERRRRERDSREGQFQHGSTGGYRNWGCRCGECTKANKEACARYHNTHRAAREVG